ncbi:hypothetical protein TNCV_44671 [Trichonephila clavipes]|nr:hypothetical protein TNCV_44671 [Trichonephila clavipes]
MVSFHDVTGMSLCPELSLNQVALRFGCGVESTLIRIENSKPLISCPDLFFLFHSKMWRRWSPFKGMPPGWWVNKPPLRRRLTTVKPHFCQPLAAHQCFANCGEPLSRWV